MINLLRKIVFISGCPSGWQKDNLISSAIVFLCILYLNMCQYFLVNPLDEIILSKKNQSKFKKSSSYF